MSPRDTCLEWATVTNPGLLCELQEAFLLSWVSWWEKGRKTELCTESGITHPSLTLLRAAPGQKICEKDLTLARSRKQIRGIPLSTWAYVRATTCCLRAGKKEGAIKGPRKRWERGGKKDGEREYWKFKGKGSKGRWTWINTGPVQGWRSPLISMCYRPSTHVCFWTL